MANVHKASSMAELMAAQKTTLVKLNKGEVITGVITKLSTSEITLDINAKTEAVVLEKERKLVRAMLAMFKVGDTVQASVLNPESDNGSTVVSLRRFLDDKIWDRLTNVQKNHEKIDVTIKGLTKGGYLVETKEGIDGFLPNSHVSFNQETTDLVGKTLTVMIAELNHETRKLIVSQKPVLGSEDFTSIIKQLKKGNKVDAIVSHITSFGLFVSIPVKGTSGEETFLDGLIHISEVSWEKVNELTGIYAVGDPVEVVVLGFDSNAKRVDLSIKQLTADPFEEVLKNFAVDQKVTGKVTKLIDAGIVIDLGEEGVEGFIKKEKVPPTIKYEVGQEVKLSVVDIDKKKHRINLAPILLDKPLMYR